MEKKRAKVLVVDDSEINRIVLKEILKDEYEILEASDGKAALQIIREYKTEIALVLLDIVMPEMDGIAVLEEMNREKWMIERIPVIIISADQHEKTLNKAFDLGTTDYILRPLNALLVKHRVKNTIQLFTKLNYAKRILELQERADRDPMTNLLNKVTMEKRVQVILENSDPNTHYILMILDVDNLKYLNDTKGHSAGDKYLKLVASQMKKGTRADDLLGRTGGDEFLIFFRYDGNPDSIAQNIYERILTVGTEEMTWNGDHKPDIAFSLSAGYTTTEASEYDYQKMFDDADTALYIAKKSGKNICIGYNRDNKKDNKNK